MSVSILLVEDDRDVAGSICMALEDESWQIEHVANGLQGLERARAGHYDLLILDVRLPGMSGFDLCRELRRTSQVPVLFLTARAEEMDKVVGLELGGDDYLTKPFGLHELKARIRALLRRAHPRPGGERQIRVHDLLILPERRSVYRGDQRIHLTNSEYLLLVTLAGRPGMVFTREMLMERLWESDLNTGAFQTVTAHIRNLRERLDDSAEQPRYIATVRGVGYRLVEEAT